MTTDYVTLYDSTLRDGSQARGVDFTVSDKRAIAEALDRFGIDYIEGGWPGANPRDDAFFADPPPLKTAGLVAFGMTRRAGRSASNDPGLRTLLDAGTKTLCLVGKSWDFHIEKMLGLTPEENRRIIAESVELVRAEGRELFFDAEHFFDGYKANPTVALDMAKAAYDAGARWIVLCDTNGGSMPDEIERITAEVARRIPGEKLGIHCHNDTEQAVAGTLAAVRAGARHVQGTINGIGERCGNANLISIIPNLVLKMGMRTAITPEKLTHLCELSHLVDDRLNRTPFAHAPYVGNAAFAHKGGLHVSAMAKDSASYEHVPPEAVGNERTILVSDKAGRANIVSRLGQLGLHAAAENRHIEELVALVKERERQGYAYEAADASFELLARRCLGEAPPNYFELHHFRVLAERRWNARGELVTLSEATVKLVVGGKKVMTVGEGNGPVDALDAALRKALSRAYPAVKAMRLVDYKVRILTPEAGTKAVTRVLIESQSPEGERWTTLGVSPNVIDASYGALFDAIVHRLSKIGAVPKTRVRNPARRA